MRRPVRPLVFTLMLCLVATLAKADGTPAGLLIDSQAMVTYTQAGENRTTLSNRVSLPVNEVLDFTLAWQDAAPVPVYAGDAAGALTFRLRNIGNGSDIYHFTAINALSGDDFDPPTPDIHFDTNHNGVFDPLLDDVYTPGDNDPELPADTSLTVFLVGPVPDDLDQGDRGDLKLAVGSAEGYGTPGTVLYNLGDDGTDAIIGPGGGFSAVTGTLLLEAVQVTLVKSAQVLGAGGQPLAPGVVDSLSVVTYHIDVTVVGSGTARDVVITDPLPPGTVYRPGTLFLNETPLTDAVDSDAGDVAGQLEGTVTIALGDLMAGAPAQRISFQVALE